MINVTADNQGVSCINKLDNDLLVSRYFSIDDLFMRTFTYKYGLFGHKKLKWDFVKLKWWSRAYEYKWISDALKYYYGESICSKSVLDAGCGNSQPGCFILENLGFKEIVAHDLYERHGYIEKVNSDKIKYISKDLGTKLEGRYDSILCISTLEHIIPEQQERVLRNLCSVLNKGGIILLTFDLPGFEYVTNIHMYKDVLNDAGLSFKIVKTPLNCRLSSKNGIINYPGWPEMHVDELFCYRIAGVNG